MIYAFVPHHGSDERPKEENETVERQADTKIAEQAKKERLFRDICDKMLDTYHKKNLDYGNSFGESFKEFGITAAVIRLGDKYRRIRSLGSSEALVTDESVKDTLLDLANYAIMTLIELEKG